MEHPQTKDKIDLYKKDKYGNNLLMEASTFHCLDIINYLIVKKSFKVDKETLAWLKGDNNQKVFHDTLKIIENHELNIKLNKELSQKNIKKNILKI